MLNFGVGRQNLFDKDVERNAFRANLVDRVEAWPWSSLGGPTRQSFPREIISDWPLPRPANWTELVNRPQTEAEAAALRQCVIRGAPYGKQQWIARTAKQLRLESTLRPRGRPKKRSGGQ